MINLGTDNIFTLTSFVSDKMGRDKKEIFKAFELPSDFDYPE